MGALNNSSLHQVDIKLAFIFLKCICHRSEDFNFDEDQFVSAFMDRYAISKKSLLDSQLMNVFSVLFI